MIYEDIHDLAMSLDKEREKDPDFKVILTCGGFDPVHIGHLRCFQESSELKNDYKNAVFVIVANADGFLKTKKGRVFMPEKERMEILHGFKGVDHVTRWYDGTQHCADAIRILKPNVFTKGGDRDSRNKIPEGPACDEVGCEIKFGVGGKKIQSSSWLTKHEV